MIRATSIFIAILLLTYACNSIKHQPIIGGNDVAVDPISGKCYRLAYLPATDHYPESVVTTDGVDCPYGIGR